MRGTIFDKRQTRIRRKHYRKVPHQSHGRYLSRRLRRERRITVEESLA